jgi:hypothetical protein
MRWLGFILVACLAIALLKATVIVLLIVLGLMTVWGVLFRPVETFGFVALLGFMSLLEQRPIAVLVLIGLLGLVALLCRPDSTPQEPYVLPDQSATEETST